MPKISAATGVKLALEGIYRWLCFMPSKQDPKRPVATRYFGVFEDGSLKVRGLCSRRRDTPPFVRRAQEALLAKMAEAVTPADLLALKPELGKRWPKASASLSGKGRIRPLDLRSASATRSPGIRLRFGTSLPSCCRSATIRPSSCSSNIAVTPSFNVAPDLQVVFPAREQSLPPNPQPIDTALVLGLRVKIDF